MTPLRKKIDNSLNEARILVLGTEVLLGMNFRAAFQRVFVELSRIQQAAKVAGLALLIVTLILLMLPASFHRLVETGNDTTRLHRVLGLCLTTALFLLGSAIGIDSGVVVGHAFGESAGTIAGIAITATAFACWWILEMVVRRVRPAATREKDQMAEKKRTHETDVDERVENVLTEARLILPGAQALLGFQLAAMMLQEFGDIPRSSRMIHLASFAAVCLATILLMAPSAYHRIVERGENSERFERLAGRFVVSAMIPLALGISGDFYVVLRRAELGVGAAAGGAGVTLLLFYGAWFAAPLLYRRIRGGFDEYRDRD